MKHGVLSRAGVAVLAALAITFAAAHYAEPAATSAAGGQSGEFTVYCPQRIQIGPVNVAKEWGERLNTWVEFSHATVGAEAGAKEQLVGCWYGDASRPASIGQKVSAAYACKVNGISVTCKVRIKIKIDD